MKNKGQMGFAGIVIVTIIGILFLVVGTQIVNVSVCSGWNATSQTCGNNASAAVYTGVSQTIASNLVPFMLLGGLALAGTLAFFAFRGK